MDLSNLIKTIAHYLLIRGITYLDHQDRFLMVSALVYSYILDKTYNESRHKTIDYHDSSMLA